MNGAINLGKIFGIQIRLHYSWFIIFALLVVSLVSPDWDSGFAWGIGIITCILFFASVVAHEMSHSLVGRANGIPVSSITMFIFGGMAMMTKEAARPGAEFKMAAAGPVCSAILGAISLLIWMFAPLHPLVATMFAWLMYMNFALAVFNLIPGFPLDGGRIFRAFLWRRSGDFRGATRLATRVGQGVAYVFIGGGIAIVILSQFFPSQVPFGLNWFSGVWIAFIGWFLLNAAQSSYRQTEWREALRRFTASQVMTGGYPVVPPGVTLSRLVEEHIFPSAHRLFWVAGEEEKVAGVLPLDAVKKVPRDKWSMTAVRDIMKPLTQLDSVSPDTGALEVLEKMNATNADQVLVLAGGRIKGLVTRENLMGFLRVHSELAPR